MENADYGLNWPHWVRSSRSTSCWRRQRHRGRHGRGWRARGTAPQVIFWGIGAAIVLRIFFALITTQLRDHRPDAGRRRAAVGLLEDVPRTALAWPGRGGA